MWSSVPKLSSRVFRYMKLRKPQAQATRGPRVWCTRSISRGKIKGWQGTWIEDNVLMLAASYNYMVLDTGWTHVKDVLNSLYPNFLYDTRSIMLCKLLPNFRGSRKAACATLASAALVATRGSSGTEEARSTKGSKETTPQGSNLQVATTLQSVP